VHLHLLQAQHFLAANHDVILAGRITHGVGTIMKLLIGFGIVIGVVIALAVSSLMKKK
jgi:hypothetical protein